MLDQTYSWRARDPVSSEPLIAVIDALPVLIAYIDRDERYQFANKAHVQWFGASSEDTLGHLLADVLGQRSYAVIKPHIERALAGEQASFIGALPLRERADRFVRITFTPHRDQSGRLAGCFGLVEDLSDLQATGDRPHPGRDEAESLQKQKDGSRTARDLELAQMMRVRILGDMTTALAHELSQPLSATLAYIQGSLRLMRAGDTVSPDLIKHMEKAAEQARRAGDIVRHIRRFARRDRPARCQVDLGLLVQDVVKLVAAETESSGIALSLDLAADLPKVTVEPVAIEQVILNLLHNSIEALNSIEPSDGAEAPVAGCSPASRRIHIAGRLARAGVVHLAISDTGPGIPDQVAEHLFEPFVTAKPGGVGLGLAICRTIIREHGGDLWLDDVTAPGATFVFSLPTRGIVDDNR